MFNAELARVLDKLVHASIVDAARLSGINTNRTLLMPDAVLGACDSAFNDAGETNNIIRNYELMIAKVSRSAAYVDLLRYRLAQVYQNLGEDEKALPLLKQIKNYRMNRVPGEIAAIEERLGKK